jgi:secernin
VCDTFCVIGDGVTLLAKNSDRPMSEPQIVTVAGPRSSGGRLATQYIEIPDAGACSTLLSRPTWLWGAEHGMNEHRVAIGNEMIFTRNDPRSVAPALLGMDLVRLGLERGRSADEALDVMTTLLELHGQGGVGDAVHGLAYWSSFLIADPTSAWVLETSGRTWAARRVTGGAAISNGLTLRGDWTRASCDVTPGTDVDEWRHPDLPTGFADIRLVASRTFLQCAGVGSLADSAPQCDPRAAVAALRDHGSGPWGAPGSLVEAARRPPPAPAPQNVSVDGPGWSLCLHAGETAVTTGSMVALLPTDPAVAPRAWFALGSPCVSVFVPVLPPPFAVTTSPALGQARMWLRFAALRDAVGSDGDALAVVRSELAPLEDALWDEADSLGTDAEAWDDFARRAHRGVTDSLDRLLAAGLGVPVP